MGPQFDFADKRKHPLCDAEYPHGGKLMFTFCSFLKSIKSSRRKFKYTEFIRYILNN
jgi:hypothetical protein